MFGLGDMYKEREKLYKRCMRQQAKAGADRALLKKQTLEAVSSTKGLIVSFVLGATTQSETADLTRKAVLKGVQTQLMSFLAQKLATRFGSHGD